MEPSEDERDAEDRSDLGILVLELNGRNAEGVWRIMVQAATLIDSAGINYDAGGPNSNSTIASVLQPPRCALHI